MARGRQEDEWSRTAEVLAMVFNCHMDTKKSVVKSARDFYPFGRGPRRERPVDGVIGAQGLKDIFIHGRMPTDVRNPE